MVCPIPFKGYLLKSHSCQEAKSTNFKQFLQGKKIQKKWDFHFWARVLLARWGINLGGAGS